MPRQTSTLSFDESHNILYSNMNLMSDQNEINLNTNEVETKNDRLVARGV